MHHSFRRRASGVLVLSGFILGSVPLMATLSLARGGNGLGVCPGGAWLCSAPYMPVARLTGRTLVGLFIVMACIHFMRATNRRGE